MGVSSPRDFFAPYLKDESFVGPFMLFARLLSTTVFVFFIFTQLFGDPDIRAYMVTEHLPGAAFVYLVFAIQIAGVLMVALGYKTRFAALLLALYTIAAPLLIVHTLRISLFKDFGIAGGFLALFAFGPGPWSLDARQELARSGKTWAEQEGGGYRGIFAPILASSVIMGPLILLGRIFVAYIYFAFGENKVVHTARMQDYMVQHNPTFAWMGQVLTILIYPAMILQVIGSIFLLLGYKTRYTALALAGFTIIAGTMFHHQFYIPTEKIQFFMDYTLTGTLLFMFAYGAGPLSLDARCSRTKQPVANLEAEAPRA